MQVAIGDTVTMRKVHPCGGYRWEVVRLGADIGLVCSTCRRRVLMPRSALEKRAKKVEPKPQTGGGVPSCQCSMTLSVLLLSDFVSTTGFG
ncbi:MAG: DUF951 domain-containing protein [SAR202 cluster bacterium]|nr:DUF951 domain-containing protein [SAR202 cluster bacterium]